MTIGESIGKRHKLTDKAVKSIDRAIREAHTIGWSAGISWEMASSRGDKVRRDKLYDEALSFNKPKRGGE